VIFAGYSCDCQDDLPDICHQFVDQHVSFLEVLELVCRGTSIGAISSATPRMITMAKTCIARVCFERGVHVACKDDVVVLIVYFKRIRD
jgi:hypothetical protein